MHVFFFWPIDMTVILQRISGYHTPFRDGEFRVLVYGRWAEDASQERG